MPENSFGVVVLEEAIDRITSEWDKASNKFLDDLWQFDWFGFLRALLFGGDEAQTLFLDRMLIIINSFLQDVGLIPARIIGDLASYILPVAKVYRQRVVRGDQAFATFVTEFIDIGIDVATFNWTGNSGLILYAKRIKSWLTRFKLYTQLTEESVLAFGKSRLTAIILLFLQIVFVTVVSLTVLLVVFTLWQRFNDPKEESRLLSHMLPQDSVRKRLRRPKGFEVRLNARAGRDK